MLTKPREDSQGTSMYTRKKRRFSPLLLIGASVTVVLVLVGGVFFAMQQRGSSGAAAVNMNCSLTIPPNPLSAQGLATPYQLVATNPAQGPCNEANPNQSAFVQAAIIDPATGKVSIYEPLVIDQGTQPAVAPVVPHLPARAVVALWFGDNGNTLTLLRNNARGNHNTQRTHVALRGGANANCVNGTPGSPFGQFAYCNAPAFFAAAHAAIAAHKLVIPALGTGNDGLPCPTVRSFRVVDMDQSDNVQTRYLVTANGQVAQFSAANQGKLANATTIGNPSDNALVSRILDPALGCKPWTAPDLVDNNNPTAALALDELQAGAMQKAPVARVPLGDPMTLVNGQPSATKTNLYRMGVNQRLIPGDNGNTTTYCKNLIAIAIPGLQTDKANFVNQASPDTGAANSLFTFLANRLNASLGAGGLNCTGLLNIQNPVTLTTDANGVVTDATFAAPAAAKAAVTTNAAAATANTTTTTVTTTDTVGAPITVQATGN